MKLFKFFSISFSLFIFLFGFVSVNVVNADITYSTTTPKGVPVTTGTLKIGGAHSGSLSDPFQIGDTIKASGTAYCKADNCYQSSINATMIRADHQWEKANPWVNFYKDVYTTVNTITMSSFKSNTIGEYSKYYFNLHGETSFTVPSIPGDYEMSFGVFNNGDTKHFSIPFTVAPPPVNCVGSWSTCSDGSHTFTISTPVANGGAVCNPAVDTTESCGTVGYWGDWSNWGSCSVSSCGQTGTQGRTRSCIGPYGGGAPCVGDTSESQACSTAACDVTPPSGTLTGSDCVIDEGKNSCTTTLTLAITNPVTGKATNITKPTDIEVAKGITPSSKPDIVVKYPSETFYLNHNSKTLNLDGTTIKASCDSTKNLVWDDATKKCKAITFTITTTAGPGGSITTTETTGCSALSTNGNIKTYKKDCSVVYNIIPDAIHDIKDIYFNDFLRYSLSFVPGFSYSRSISTYVSSGNPSLILTDYRKSSVSIYGDVKYHSSAKASFKMDKNHTINVDFACLNNADMLNPNFINTCARVNVDGPGVLTAKPGEDRNVSYNVQTTTNAGTECRVLDNNKKELEGDSGIYKIVTKGNEYGASMSGITIPDGDGPYLYYIQCRDRITTDAIGLASVTINTKVGNCINGVCGDACGTGSSTTPQLTEPTQLTKDYKACEIGTLNSSTPSDIGLQTWKWSCGSVTTCSTPKFGCRITTDSNYSLPQYGANGPDNNYGCASTCENGAAKSTWPACSEVGTWSTLTCSSTLGTPATTLTATCSVAGTCTGTAPTKNCPAVSSSTGTWSTLTCSTPAGISDVTLTATCSIPGTCVPSTPPTKFCPKLSILTPISVSLSATPAGPLTALGATNLTWTTTGNPTSCDASGVEWSGTNLTSGVGVAQRSGMPAHTYVFGIKCHKTGVADATDTVTIVVNASNSNPSGTLSATKCTIAQGASTCISKVTWTTSNLILGKDTAVTRNNPDVTVSTTTSGNDVSNIINHGDSTFYLYNNGVELKNSPVTASCDAQNKNYWDSENNICILSGSNGETCTDKIQNQNETGIDAGGVCGGGGGGGESCTDRIMNQDETAVDYGGRCGIPIPVNGKWSDWDKNISCPLTQDMTRTRTYIPAQNGGVDLYSSTGILLIGGETESETIKKEDCPSVDITTTPDLSGKCVPYNSFVNVNWKSLKTSSCSCTYSDAKNTNEPSCILFPNTTEGIYKTPALKRDTTYTISCEGKIIGEAKEIIKICVDPINTNYLEN